MSEFTQTSLSFHFLIRHNLKKLIWRRLIYGFNVIFFNIWIFQTCHSVIFFTLPKANIYIYLNPDFFSFGSNCWKLNTLLKSKSVCFAVKRNTEGKHSPCSKWCQGLSRLLWDVSRTELVSSRGSSTTYKYLMDAGKWRAHQIIIDRPWRLFGLHSMYFLLSLDSAVNRWFNY